MLDSNCYEQVAKQVKGAEDELLEQKKTHYAGEEPLGRGEICAFTLLFPRLCSRGM